MRGLLGTSGLRPGEGLLIEPCSSIHSLGMRYRFDAVFVDRQGRVVRAVPALAPNRVAWGGRSAHAVFELPAGTIRATATQRGDTIQWQQAAEGTGGAAEADRVGWGRLLFDHVAPGALFAYVFFAQLVNFRELWQGQGPAAGLDQADRTLLLIQRALVTGNVGLVALFFAVRRARRGARAQIIPSAVALAAVAALGLQALRPPAVPLPLLTGPGSLLIILGSLVTVTALAGLARSFGVLPEARGLVTHGLYRYVRHPMYLGEILSALGAILPAISPATLALFGAFVVLQYWRAANEERALTAVFPAYAAYARRTPRIVPGIR